MATSLGKIKTQNWLDAWGFAVKTNMQLGGLPVEIKQSNEIEAKQSPESREFLLNSLISLKKEIPSNAQSVKFKMELTKGKLSHPLYRSELQKVTKLDDKNLIIEIKAEKWGKNTIRRKKEFKIAQEFKTANLMIDSDNPLIRQLAQNAGKGSKNIIELSEKLFFFAQKYLIDKNFKVGFASATETAKEREGDCTEHAVFLAALGRAMGIPTRVAYGIAYLKSFKGNKNVMGFHMWTEFHLRGKWMRLDSALGKIGTHADRITLSVTSLNQESLTQLGLGIAEMIGNVKLTINNIEISEG
jgi:transglutaminase-like putative cysteine protease